MQEDTEFYRRVSDAVDARLSGRRLAHSHSVSDYAVELARIYGVNQFDAAIAGLLHDWDKLIVDDDFPARLDELGIPRPEHIELLYPVLHSFTGARAVRREFPELTDEIESAIWHHTLGGLHMGDLDKVIFIADMIEPLRKTKGRPLIKKLREMVGTMSLDDLYFEAYVVTMDSLVIRKRFIHPAAFDIWNGLVQQHTRKDKSRQGDPNVIL